MSARLRRDQRTQPLTERIAWVCTSAWWVIATEPVGAVAREEYMQRVFDGRVGLRVDLDPFQLELAWVGVSDLPPRI